MTPQQHRIMGVLIALAALAGGLTIPAWGQRALKFERLGISDGLSQNSVLCIVQDRQGFMWFGTEEGLNRYDGYHFTTFTHDERNSNSLSDSYILSLYVDARGDLWIGTAAGGWTATTRCGNASVISGTTPRIARASARITSARSARTAGATSGPGPAAAG